MPTLANIAKINGIVISGAAAPTDRHILLGTQTASGSATLSFSGINSHRSDVLRSSFDVLEFRFTNMHPVDDDVQFQFQVNATDGADFNDSLITSTAFHGYHNEADSSNNVLYQTDFDLAQQALYQNIAIALGNADKESVSGVLTLYAPSSTTYVKHFTSVMNGHMYHDYTSNFFSAGYINQTLAIPEISFKMSSGNIDAGTIHMYGVG